MDTLSNLTRRGFIHQCTQTEGLDQAFRAGTVPVYAGFDATADSLHIGHLLPIMFLRRLQRAGHKPIVLIGGGTTRIGDPSFRSESRPMLTDEQIAANITGIRRVFDRFLTFGDGATDAILVNNADWLDRLGYIDMLREVGPHFSVNRMLSFDSVKSRLDRQESLSFLEFNYMILQAYDFLELHRRYGCRLQLGGADQWGNIVSGIDLVRRMDGEEVFGVTAPLLTTASGAKMGKTAAGAVWLNADRLSPYDYWQFWRNTEDRDVGRFLCLFTDLDESEIVRLESLEGSDINAAKTVLADEATRLAHGEDARLQAAETAAGAFGSGESLDGLPVIEVPGSVSVVDLLVQAKLVSSKSEARRLILNRGARINDEVVEDDGRLIDISDELKLSAGRKKHVLVRPG
ncbi:tyrosyl-tRNA synthetase [Asticcacaulis sp. AC460]|uniref:tyrosine--tRNA ligase n=1 Tax=Asticcacaulis sp. AC460 TaxID=1282360 RepID=UPI0003C41297|nr:tyrosine--tRNA ligase [Asticcacaulis sp. AC460]ESQ87473.1 tyrosyl-tRNA synthetase [Asticcacaulis sp. AC460]